MGIPHYFYVISKTYTGIIKDVVKICDYLFIDFNGIIHMAANKVLNSYDSSYEVPFETIENAIIKESWSYLQYCISVSKAKKVYVCTDGVAPLAKINQQRKRRYLSVYGVSTDFTKWNRNAISPHTEFMNKLCDYMKEKCAVHNIYFSGADEPGEGEHKIFEIINTIPSNTVPFPNIYIYGLDADLIMLSLCSHRKNITLMRENTNTNDETFTFLNVNNLRAGILEELEIKYKWIIKNEIDTIDSYITLCFLLGNDFLPHSISLNLKRNGYEQLLRATARIYESGCDSSLVVNNTINEEFLLNIFGELKNDENKNVLEVIQDYQYKKPMEDKDKREMYPLYNKDPLVEIILTDPSHWRPSYYKYIFYRKLNDTKIIVDTCKTFITGIYWTFAYYKRLPKDDNYQYPFGYAPTFLDLYNYLTGSTQEFKELLSSWTNLPKTSIHPIIQLMCILPPESMYLLPESCHKYLMDSKYGVKYMFPMEYKVQTFLKTYLWECTPILPIIDVKVLSDIVII